MEPKGLRDPDFVGRAGKAWKVFSDGCGQPQCPCRFQWLLHVPGAHPFWDNYTIGMIDLGGIVAFKPVLYVPGATHEFLIYAVDPDWVPTVEPRASVAVLWPANFYAQLLADSDEAAVARVDFTVQEVVDGELNPDTDARAQWIARFGDACVRRDSLLRP